MNGMLVTVDIPQQEEIRSRLRYQLAEQVPEERMDDLLNALLSGSAMQGEIMGKKVQLRIVTTAILDGLMKAESKCVINHTTARSLATAYFPNAPWHRDNVLNEIKVRCRYPAYSALSRLGE